MRERIVRRAALEFKDGMYGILLKYNYVLNQFFKFNNAIC